MQRSDVRIGMKVVFGRSDNAEKSLGEVVKVNPTTAKVKLLEERGTRRQYAPGMVWKVPYSLMEAVPANGDKDSVSIKGRTYDASVQPGMTFRSAYADGNPLWKVVEARGRGTWLCEIVNEPIEYNGRVIGSDFAGTRKAFLTGEITRSVNMAKMFENLHDEHASFYANLKVGQTVHYHNGFNTWVRCTVVRDGNENKLKPVALLGPWARYDLAHRNQDGTLAEGYYVKKIRTGELFTPNASNLFEAGCKPGDGIDPNTLSPLDLSVPEMTPAEAATAALWQKVQEIHELTSQHVGDPKEILDQVAKLSWQFRTSRTF